MRRVGVFAIAAVAAVAALAVSWSARPSEVARAPRAAPAHPQRIICLSPGITETVFALGLGSRVVGVTSHTYYPPAAAHVPRVGDWLATNIEAVVALRPDLVLVSSVDTEVGERLKTLGLRYVVVKQDTVGEIVNSIRQLGAVCGAPTAGQKLATRIEDRLRRIAHALAGRTRPRTLVCVGRDYGSGKLDQVYIAGQDSFYSQLVRMAGGKNAYQGPGIPFPAVSGEGIMQLDPDVILDIVPERARLGLDRAKLVNAWKALPDLAAVKHGRVYVLDGDYMAIPGPRVVQALEAIARTLHPGVSL